MNTGNKKGFTIIEVVLVLAIAGLIFLMVFIALPALQRNQRDAARKQESGKIASAITSYQSNNSGKFPTNNNTGMTNFAKYVDGTASGTTITLNTGTTITLQASAATGTTPVNIPNTATNDNIVVITGAKCSTSNSAQYVKGTARSAAVAIRLENADAMYCQTN